MIIATQHGILFCRARAYKEKTNNRNVNNFFQLTMVLNTAITIGVKTRYYKPNIHYFYCVKRLVKLQKYYNIVFIINELLFF